MIDPLTNLVWRVQDTPVLDMTLFQQQCLTALKKRVAEKSFSFEFLEVRQGRTEEFIQGQLGDTLFWIYEDMADTKQGMQRRFFERPDYASSEALVAAFVHAVAP